MSGEHESTALSRDLPFEPGRSGLLVVDMQNLCAARGRGEDADGEAPPDHYYYSRLERTVVPNSKLLIEAFRSRGLEVVYTVIESLTLDGRDRSLDHKLSGYNVPKGSEDARAALYARYRRRGERRGCPHGRGRGPPR